MYMSRMSSPSKQSLKPPTQLIVLGRGMERDSDIPTPATIQRAEAARVYYEKSGNTLGKVIFSGGRSRHAVNRAFPVPSEAEIMAGIADLPSDLVELESQSTSTLENFLHAAVLLAGDPDATTAVLAHSMQLPRALFIARKVLICEVIGVAAEEYGAMPEDTNRTVEQVAFLKDRVLLAGIHRGDVDTIANRADRMRRVQPLLGKFLRKNSQYN